MSDSVTDTAPPAEEHPFEGRAERGALWVVVGYGGAQLIRLLGNLILTRLLFEEAFGVMALMSTVLQGLELFSDIGIGPSLIQNERQDDSFVNTAWTMQAARGVAIWLVACAVALGWILQPFWGAILWAVIIALLFLPMFRRLLPRVGGRVSARAGPASCGAPAAAGRNAGSASRPQAPAGQRWRAGRPVKAAWLRAGNRYRAC